MSRTPWLGILLSFLVSSAVATQSGWVLRTPATSPTIASSFNTPAMTFDAVRGKAVMTAVMVNVMEVWEWDGVNWIQQSPAASPQPGWGTV
jgi:hypothetical protein